MISGQFSFLRQADRHLSHTSPGGMKHGVTYCGSDSDNRSFTGARRKNVRTIEQMDVEFGKIGEWRHLLLAKRCVEHRPLFEFHSFA